MPVDTAQPQKENTTMAYFWNASFFQNIKKKFLALAAALLLMSSPAFAAQETAYTPSAQELKKMSVFLSNFTELGFMNFDVQKDGGEGLHLGAARALPKLIHFGIWHNYHNNFSSRITHCTEGCPHGSLRIKARYVAASVKKYFDLPVQHQSVPAPPMPYYFDGNDYHFEGADGEVAYLAQVEKVVENADGTVRMTGYLYNAEDKTERSGTFEALAKAQNVNGKKTWAILSLKTVGG
jgi:hypothetical protein